VSLTGAVGMLRIPYLTEDFPTGTVANGYAALSVTWDDILWAAVTVGRPNRHYVFRHGAASMYEALFRWSLVRMALEQSGPRGSRLRRTTAAKTLDPTEKGAVNYFLGMMFCKLFATNRLNTPWLLHLDVFRPRLNPVLTGRSRPDLVGRVQGLAQWHAFECKGRVSPPDATAKSKAKAQAQRLVSVNGTPCTLHVGALTYFRGDSLHFYWRDPPAENGKSVDVPMSGDAWRHYYEPVLDVVRTSNAYAPGRDQNTLVPIECADVSVGVHPTIAKYLANRQWERAQQAAIEAAASIEGEGYQPDGLKVVAGESWAKRFAEPGMAEEG
jgi:hypothetical protein